MKRSGFTLIEMLVVIAIIGILVSLTFAGYYAVKASTRRKAAAALVSSAAATISSDGRQVITVYAEGSQTPVRRKAWDVDGDGILDGELTPVYYWEPAPAAGVAQAQSTRYRGFFYTISPPGITSVDRQNGEVIDPWRRPLRIAYVAKLYGDEGFCVWSSGKDSAITTDDIRSRE